MISIIICSRVSEISAELRQNIRETIGFEYELVVIDNSGNQYTIFSAYNEGVRRAKGEILCFMHEDILFKSKDWGKIVNETFKDSSIGLIGVSGAHFLPSCPLYWVESPFITTTNVDKIDGQEFCEYKKELMNGAEIVDAVACDGQWLCLRKNQFDNICFDELTFTGFHLYDMDICLQVLQQGMRVCVVDGILIEHHSRGNFDERFETALGIFYNKWKDFLPLWRGLDSVPQYSLEKIDSVYKSNHFLYGKNRQIYKSNNYRLGYYLLLPFRKLKTLIQK